MHLIHLRNDKWKKFKVTNRDIDWQEYVKLRNNIKSRLRALEDVKTMRKDNE